MGIQFPPIAFLYLLYLFIYVLFCLFFFLFFFSYIIHIFVQWYKALLNLNLNLNKYLKQSCQKWYLLKNRNQKQKNCSYFPFDGGFSLKIEAYYNTILGVLQNYKSDHPSIPTKPWLLPILTLKLNKETSFMATKN